MLKSVLYLSESRFVPTSFDLENMSLNFRKLNKQSNITGFLIFTQSRFFQYIEGEEEIIDKLLSKIKCDTRHLFISESSKMISSRLFNNWDMKVLHFNSLTKVLPENKLVELMILNSSHPNPDVEWENNAWEIITRISKVKVAVNLTVPRG